MRTPLLAVLIAALVPACMDGLTGVGDDDDTGGAVCGNGAVENGEACDDGNAAAGDGCSATCQMETANTPRVTATVDKPTASVNLARTETITLTLQGAGGFAGDVTLAATLVNGSDVAVPNVTVTGPASVTLSADGTQTAAFDVAVPMNATGQAIPSMLKVDMTSTAGMSQVTSAVTINNIYVIDYAAGTGTAAGNHMNTGSVPNLVVKRGAILRFHNSDTIRHIIHGDGTTFPHEDQNDPNSGKPGRDYDVLTIGLAPGDTGTLGCHDHTTATYSDYMVQ